MQLKDLKKSISEMSEEELEKLVLEIRESRRTKKKVVERKKRETAKKESNSLATLIDSLSDDDREALIKALEG